MPSLERGSAWTEAPTVPHLRPASSLPRLAAGPVAAIASVVTVLLLVLSGRYGYLSDELYFLAAGKYYLDWGYMDQQPLVPLLTTGIDAIAPGSLWALRLPAVLATVLGILVTALTTRELGGDRRAQTLAAGAYALSPWLLLSGHWMAAATLEPPQWATIIWLVTRWVRLYRNGARHDLLLLWAALITTLALQTKFQVGVLCAAVLIAAAAVGPRALPRSPVLWLGAALATATTVPTLLWQAAHHWPALEMGIVVGEESDRLLLLPTALFYSGVVVGAAFCCYGLWQLFAASALRDYRFLGWAIAAIVVFYLLVSARANYFASLYSPLFAAAAAGAQHRRPRMGQSRWTWLTWPAFVLSAVLPLAFLPIYPLTTLHRHPELPNSSRLYETGWPELARTVADAYEALPPEKRQHTAIIGESYHLAAALDIYAPRVGLPRAYGPNRGYWFFGRPPEDADTVLYVGNGSGLDGYFATHEQVDVVGSELVNLAQGVAIVRYEHRTQPWARIWPEIRTL